MADLIREGKILHWGISEATEDYLRRAHKVCPVTAVQNRYSMMARWHENLFPVLEEPGCRLCGLLTIGERAADRLLHSEYDVRSCDRLQGLDAPVPPGEFRAEPFAPCPLSEIWRKSITLPVADRTGVDDEQEAVDRADSRDTPFMPAERKYRGRRHSSERGAGKKTSMRYSTQCR